jgi:hypothetical protein
MHHTRPALLLALAASLALCVPGFAKENEKGFVPLFNGKSLDGWRKVGGGATYKIEDDCIVGTVGPGPNTFLRTEKEYGDFILKLELKLDVPGNSGVQFRSHQRGGDGRVYGYQMEVDPSDRRWAGGIYDEARRGWLYPLAGKPEAQNAFKREGWNTYEIRAIGPHLQTFVNGVPCADLLDAADLSGFIALQVHSGKEGQIRWRNIRLKDLGQSRWRPLADKDLSGWEKIGGGQWTYKNGVIHGTSTKDEPRHGLLITDKTYDDFAVRVKYKVNQGDSGLYFRVKKAEPYGVEGFQAEIDQSEQVGGLYETGGRGWVVEPNPKDVKKWSRPDDWNEMTVIAIGPRVVVHLGGHKTAELKNDPDLSGHIALQLHGGQDMDVEFKDVEILEVKDGAK